MMMHQNIEKRKGYILKLFHELEESGDNITSEEAFFISKNHKPYDFSCQDECDDFLKEMIRKGEIDPDLVSFEIPTFIYFSEGSRINIKGKDYTVKKVIPNKTIFEYILESEPGSKESVLSMDYNTKEFFFKQDPDNRIRPNEILIEKRK